MATYYVEKDVSIVDGNTFCDGRKCTYADTIIIRGGARGSLKFRNFDGNGSYITIANEKGTSKVEITGNGADGSVKILTLDNCKYVDLRGNNDSSIPYGIKVINDGFSNNNATVWTIGETEHIKLSYLEIAYDGNTTLKGIGIIVQDMGLTSAWTFSDFEIHHNYIHNTKYCAMYLGHNRPVDDNNPYIGTFSVHDNRLEDLGAYGICAKGVHSSSNNISIYNNSVNNTGLVASSPDNAAHSGISLSFYYGDAYARVYNNTVSNTKGAGIRLQSPKGGVHQIYNNKLLGCGTGNNESFGNGVAFVWGAKADIYDNIIIQPTRYGIWADEHTTNSTDSRNLIGGAGLGERFVESGGTMTEGTGADANIYHTNVADFNFKAWSDDGNYRNDDFTIMLTAITCDNPTPHQPSGCALLNWSDINDDGVISTTNTAAGQLARGEITQEEFDFIEKAVNAGSINALCPGCYPAITCDSPTDNHASGCALLNWSDINDDGVITTMGTADRQLADGLITQREHDFVYKAWEAGSLNALCPGCFSVAPPAITCDNPTPHQPSGCDLLNWSDHNNDGVINTTNTASDQLAKGEITQEEFDFIEKAVNAGSINALCPGCYSGPSHEISFIIPPGSELWIDGVRVL